MQINVSGRKVRVGDALRSHIVTSLEELAEKYFCRAIEAQVTVAKRGRLFDVDCAIHLGHGIHLQSHAEGAPGRAAFDLAAEKLEKQLRRHKRRLKDRHLKSRHGQEEEIAQLARAYVLAPASDDGAGDAETPASGSDEQPIIIAETRVEIPRLTVGDAVMLLDLANAPALMFRNRRNDQINMIYRRADGHIGWVDPGQGDRA
ncbi:MAG: ribosome hibernation-promoting factor, HPF/YfiA family [Rhodothalassiaceae bacterium]